MGFREEAYEREERERKKVERKLNFLKRLAKHSVSGLLLFVLFLGSFNIVPEGHVGIQKRFSKAIAQVDPGWQWKVPIIDSIENMEVRPRKNTEELASATANQLPVAAIVSVNWSLNKDAALSTFIEYGGLAQFEERILDPRIRTATKAAISSFRADEMIRNRLEVRAKVQENLLNVLEGFPITINSPEIENFSLPPKYLEAVEAKERAREDAEREKHKLDQQNLIAQQAVNTAKAEAEATLLNAKADAEAIRLKGEAQAAAIKEVQSAIKGDPLIVQYKFAERWNGTLPQTVLGEGVNMLMNMK